MSQPDESDPITYLAGGRQVLQMATETYGRALAPQEYWWMGVGLAAVTLADLSGRSFAVGRLEQLVERLGHKGSRGDWMQRFVEELAELDAEGLLWPLYQRGPQGNMDPTGIEVSPQFDGEAAYFLTLGHIGVALAVQRESAESVTALAQTIQALVENGATPEREGIILNALRQPQTPEVDDAKGAR